MKRNVQPECRRQRGSCAASIASAAKSTSHITFPLELHSAQRTSTFSSNERTKRTNLQQSHFLFFFLFFDLFLTLNRCTGEHEQIWFWFYFVVGDLSGLIAVIIRTKWQIELMIYPLVSRPFITEKNCNAIAMNGANAKILQWPPLQFGASVVGNVVRFFGCRQCTIPEY